MHLNIIHFRAGYVFENEMSRSFSIFIFNMVIEYPY